MGNHNTPNSGLNYFSKDLQGVISAPYYSAVSTDYLSHN